MKNTVDVKEKLIAVTKELILQANGEFEKITIRSIAEKAGVGVGLINYHFQTKENLIEQCVQDVITTDIKNFHPNIDFKNMSPLERINISAKGVADFLVDNKEMSRISILGDLKNPSSMDNTFKTITGFLYTFTGSPNCDDTNIKQLAFMLCAVMQSAFLRNDVNLEILGFDFFDKKDRDNFIDLLTTKIFGGTI